MPWNLLIIPLVSGYFFITRSYLFKYKYRLLDRQKLLFESVIAAAIFLIVSYGLAVILATVISDDYVKQYYSYRPFPYAGTAVISFLLSLFASYVPNLIISKDKVIKAAIREHGTAFDRLILESIESPQQICFTLDNGKVYIGYPKSVSDLVNAGMVSIFPFYSGYRDDRQDLVITTFYESFYVNLQDDDPENDDIDFVQLIAVNRIISAKRFDMDYFDKFGSLDKSVQVKNDLLIVNLKRKLLQWIANPL
jgi:hypothetical protein